MTPQLKTGVFLEETTLWRAAKIHCLTGVYMQIDDFAVAGICM